MEVLKVTYTYTEDQVASQLSEAELSEMIIGMAHVITGACAAKVPLYDHCIIS